MNKKNWNDILTILLVISAVLIVAVTIAAVTINTSAPLNVKSLNVKSIGDGWISVDVTTSGDGIFGVDIDKNIVWTETVNNNTVGAGNQFQLTQGKHNICTYILNNKQNTIMCATTNN